MRRLVFGEDKTERRFDPVERRIQQLIRESFKQGARPDVMQCDMDIEASYSRPSPSMGGVSEMKTKTRSNSLDDLNDMDIEPL